MNGPVQDVIGNFRLATATKSSTATGFFPSNICNPKRLSNLSFYILHLFNKGSVESCLVVIDF
jgi:hypothetical protein